MLGENISIFTLILGKISILTKGLVQPPTSVWSLREFLLAHIFFEINKKCKGSQKNVNFVELRKICLQKVKQKLALFPPLKP